MLEWVLVRSRAVPPEPPKRRGATSLEPEGDGFNPFWGMLAAVPWGQVCLGVLVVVLAGMVPWGASQVLTTLDRQIMAIDVHGELVGESQVALERQVGKWVGRSFFATDLAEIKDALEQRPWVQSAAVRRVWPDRLVVDIREKKPLAYWNQDQLVSRTGQLFRPGNREVAGRLPQLAGPDERVEDVIAMARTMAEALAEKGVGFAGLTLEPRGAWTLLLNNGIEVSLGRDQVNQRFERFMAVYQGQLAPRADEVERIDARYTNGVAVQWKPLDESSGSKS
ncbi:cell division protein FtsQ/DivIB [Marinobacter zhejiangensis]|uniref:Cell division protein FtsQ n=1 Tax=Marinobacter zhejiangensis TaxID=488535 RepID=A0A1I4TBN9_9GAMM|nr:cell division protein FtsQ/DivIB [Marinobacter zhejiangensis]SFM74033.1 cell division protein FtsQ [Marinobacter zhejiangensis]